MHTEQVIDMKEQLIVFDTTLRDGEQSPGASMTRDEKVRIAKVLEKMKVDVIEAGFPAASAGDTEAVQAVAKAIQDSASVDEVRAVVAGMEVKLDRAKTLLAEAEQNRSDVF